MTGTLVFVVGVMILMMVIIYCAIKDANGFRNIAICRHEAYVHCKNQREALSKLVARHRVDLDDEALWNGYKEWVKTVE